MAVLQKGITHRKDGRYAWRFQYDGQAYTGYAKTAKEATRELNERRYEAEHGMFIKEARITVNDWFNTWIETYKTGVKESTKQLYTAIYKRHVAEQIGKRKLKDVRAEQAQRILNKMAKTYSKTTVNLTDVVMIGLFDQAERNGLILKSPMRLVRMPKTESRPKKRALTAAGEKSFLEYAKRGKYYPLYRLASLTGMRIGEICGLQWNDIDNKNGVINIRHALYNGVLGTPKTGSSKRSIPMVQEARTLLREQRRQQAETHIQYAQLWEPNIDNLVFTTETGHSMPYDRIDRSTRKIIEEMKQDGIEIGDGFTFHCLRHCFATRCIENGMDFKTLQTIMGHKTLSMTMDLYADCLPNKQAEEMSKLESVL